MKLKHLLTTPCLAIAGTMLICATAQATLPYANGDLIMGFRTTGASNPDGLTSPSGTDYEINLGNATNFISGSGTITFANIGADLTAIFGAGWSTRADLFWSISGVVQPTVSGIPNNTLFATRPESSIGIQSLPWPRLSTFASGAPANKMVQMAGASFGYSAGTNATLNQLESTNTAGGLIQNAGAGSSYASFQPGGANTVGATAFGVFSGGIEGNFGGGAAGTALDLYELTPGSGDSAFLGSFQIDSTGTASYSAGVVPEPSSIAILGAGAGLLGLLRRRPSHA